MENEATSEPHETVNDVIADIKPRARLMTILGVERSRVHQLLGKGKPLPAWLLARMAGRHLVPMIGRERTGEMLLTTLERSFPAEFAPAPATEPVTTKAA